MHRHNVDLILRIIFSVFLVNDAVPVDKDAVADVVVDRISVRVDRQHRFQGDVHFQRLSRFGQTAPDLIVFIGDPITSVCLLFAADQTVLHQPADDPRRRHDIRRGEGIHLRVPVADVFTAELPHQKDIVHKVFCPAPAAGRTASFVIIDDLAPENGNILIDRQHRKKLSRDKNTVFITVVENAGSEVDPAELEIHVPVTVTDDPDRYQHQIFSSRQIKNAVFIFFHDVREQIDDTVQAVLVHGFADKFNIHASVPKQRLIPPRVKLQFVHIIADQYHPVRRTDQTTADILNGVKIKKLDICHVSSPDCA